MKLFVEELTMSANDNKWDERNVQASVEILDIDTGLSTNIQYEVHDEINMK